MERDLWDLLHGPAKKKKLVCDTRLQISLGAAQGLAYLHHNCSPRIIHRDVRSSNILLDQDLEAHLTDFGIAKSLCTSKSYTSTYILSTTGYIDPELKMFSLVDASGHRTALVDLRNCLYLHLGYLAYDYVSNPLPASRAGAPLKDARQKLVEESYWDDNVTH
ncbi:hypothetical protein OROHE_015048 [Orobanche hederae]